MSVCEEHASISHRQTAVEENQIGRTSATLDCGSEDIHLAHRQSAIWRQQAGHHPTADSGKAWSSFFRCRSLALCERAEPHNSQVAPESSPAVPPRGSRSTSLAPGFQDRGLVPVIGRHRHAPDVSDGTRFSCSRLIVPCLGKESPVVLSASPESASAAQRSTP